MRARWLKPEFFRDKKIAEAGPIVALVYQSLWCLADDSGVAPCEPERIKGEMFLWWSAVGVPEISGALRHLSRKKILTVFQAGDDVFCRLKNFKKHQPIHKPSKFRYPATGEALTWDGEALVPEISGDSQAPVVNSSPRHLSSSTSTTREAFLDQVPADRRRAVAAMLVGWEQGLGTPNMKPIASEHIDAGVLEYMARESAPDFAPIHMLRFVEKCATRKPLAIVPSSGPRTSGDDGGAALIARLAAMDAGKGAT